MTTAEKVRRARKDLADLLKGQMEFNHLSVSSVADKANVQKPMVRRLLDCVPNPTRPEIARVIGAVGFSKEDRRMAYKHMDTFSPSKPARSRSRSNHHELEFDEKVK